MSKSIQINMPFYHLDKNSNEVEIVSKNMTYSEIGKRHYSLQVNDQENYLLILELCKDISHKVKELNTILNQNKDE